MHTKEHHHGHAPHEEQPSSEESKAAEYLAGWQRAQADYQNLKKQAEKEKMEIGSFAKASMLVQFVPVLENFRRAFRHVPEPQQKEQWVVGLQHVQKQLEQLLAENGLTEIQAAGATFDPFLHEAISKEKQEGVESGIILEVLQSGWKMGEDVLLPSKVKVAE